MNADDLKATASFLASRLDRLLQAQRGSTTKRRIIIALAGVPGSGKSTISSAVLTALSERGVRDAEILPMDGFHHTKATLSAFDDPEETFRRRGAPFTFDADPFVAQVKALYDLPVTRADEPPTVLAVPGFDHATGDPVSGAVAISSSCKVILVEGNYTLLTIEPWSQIARLADEKWLVDVLREEAKRRLIKRHLATGIESTYEAAEARVEGNDLLNGDYIRANLIEPDVRIVN